MGRDDGHGDATPRRDGATAEERLRAAQEAVYGREPQAGAVERLRRLTAATAPHDRPSDGSGGSAQEDAVAPQQDDRRPAPPTPGRPLRGLVLVGSAALVAGGIGGLLTGSALHDAAPDVTRTAATIAPSPQEQLRQRVVDSRGSLTAQDYYRFYPDDLPLQWGGASTGRSWPRLRGTSTVRLEPAAVSTEVLLIVVCPTADRQYSWSVADDDGRRLARGVGDCGGFDAERVALAERSAGTSIVVRIDVAGQEGYAATLLER